MRVRGLVESLRALFASHDTGDGECPHCHRRIWLPDRDAPCPRCGKMLYVYISWRT